MRNGNENPVSKATVKIKVDGDSITKVEEGDGPINSLDRALRAALTSKFPELKALKLTDFKVRIIPEQKGTAARVRVLIESQNGGKTFGTVGVHENIIEASWQALIESFAYAHLNRENNKK